MSIKTQNDRYVFIGGSLHGMGYGIDSLVYDEISKSAKQIIEHGDETYYMHEVMAGGVLYNYYVIIPVGNPVVDKIKGRISH
jgi:hypothetical protein